MNHNPHLWVYAKLSDGTRSDTWCKWCGVSRKSVDEFLQTGRIVPDRRCAPGEYLFRKKTPQCKATSITPWPDTPAFRCLNGRGNDRDFCHAHRPRVSPHRWYRLVLSDGTPSAEWCRHCGCERSTASHRFDDHCNGKGKHPRFNDACKATCKPIPSHGWQYYGVAYRCRNPRFPHQDFCYRHINPNKDELDYLRAQVVELSRQVGWHQLRAELVEETAEQCDHDWALIGSGQDDTELWKCGRCNTFRDGTA